MAGRILSVNTKNHDSYARFETACFAARNKAANRHRDSAAFANVVNTVWLLFMCWHGSGEPRRVVQEPGEVLVVPVERLRAGHPVSAISALATACRNAGSTQT
jgi:hypothetical protein